MSEYDNYINGLIDKSREQQLDEIQEDILKTSFEVDRLKAESKRQCTWTVNENGAWDTGCDNRFEFTTGGPKENRAEYCQFCGGIIALKG